MSSNNKVIEHLPVYIPIVFGLTVLAGSWLFAKATRYNRTFLVVLTTWIGFQSVMGLVGFYADRTPGLPRIPVLLLPPVLTIIVLMSTTRGKAFVNQIDMKTLTLFHLVRVPVEIVLFWLFTYKTIPQLMTFEGRNFDIFSGLSAPLIYYFGFIGNRPNKPLLLIWNFVCLALVVNIALNGLLSAPTPFQRLAFDQPNIAIGYFPFNLLPSCLVPLVILAHVASVRQLLRQKTVTTNVNSLRT
ncbi:hypothetical protein [Spirosoma fluminis]